MDISSNLVGHNLEELQYLLFHKSSSDPSLIPSAEGQFYYNTTYDTPKFKNATAWEYFAHVKTPITAGALVIGNFAEIQKYVSTSDAFVKVGADSVAYSKEYIEFADLDSSIVCTTIVEPGDNISLTTQKAVVDYIVTAIADIDSSIESVTFNNSTRLLTINQTNGLPSYTVCIPDANDNDDNYVDSVTFDQETGTLTLGRTGDLIDLTASILESDPVFVQHVVYNITQTDIDNWNIAYRDSHTHWNKATLDTIQGWGSSGTSELMARADHTHPYTGYTGWDLKVGGVQKQNVTSGDYINFAAGTGVTLSYSNKTLTISKSASGDDIYIESIDFDPDVRVMTFTYNSTLSPLHVLVPETDPIFTSHVAFYITSTLISHWNIAYEQSHLHWNKVILDQITGWGTSGTSYDIARADHVHGIYDNYLGWFPIVNATALDKVLAGASLNFNGTAATGILVSKTDGNNIAIAANFTTSGVGNNGVLTTIARGDHTHTFTDNDTYTVSVSGTGNDQYVTFTRNDASTYVWDSRHTHLGLYDYWNVQVSGVQKQQVTNNDYVNFIPGTGIGISWAGNALTFTSTVTQATPGGLDTQVQFNDAGAFGGADKITYNKTTKLTTFGVTGTGTNYLRAYGFTDLSVLRVNSIELYGTDVHTGTLVGYIYGNGTDGLHLQGSFASTNDLVITNRDYSNIFRIPSGTTRGVFDASLITFSNYFEAPTAKFTSVTAGTAVSILGLTSTGMLTTTSTSVTVANTQADAGIVSAGGTNYNMAWATDASGNPAWRTISTDGITYTGAGIITVTGTVITHNDTSSQASVNNTGRFYIQDITLDDYGHVTAITSAEETVTNTDTWQLNTDTQNGYVLAGGNANKGKVWKCNIDTGIPEWGTDISGSAGTTYYADGTSLILNGSNVFSQKTITPTTSTNNSSRTYINGIVFDTWGHPVSYTTRTETVTQIPPNALGVAGYVAAPNVGNANMVWKCDVDGNPAWRVDATSTLYGTVTSVTGGDGLQNVGAANLADIVLKIVSHAGTDSTIGTIYVDADTIGVNLGTTSTTAAKGNHTHTGMMTQWFVTANGLNSTTMGQNSTLNFINGNNITITSNGAGGITINSTASGSGTVQQLNQGNGIILSPGPITTTGSISVAYGGSNGYYGTSNSVARFDHTHAYDNYGGWNFTAYNALSQVITTQTIGSGDDLFLKAGTNVTFAYVGGELVISATGGSSGMTSFIAGTGLTGGTITNGQTVGVSFLSGGYYGDSNYVARSNHSHPYDYYVSWNFSPKVNNGTPLVATRAMVKDAELVIQAGTNITFTATTNGFIINSSTGIPTLAQIGEYEDIAFDFADLAGVAQSKEYYLESLASFNYTVEGIVLQSQSTMTGISVVINSSTAGALSSLSVTGGDIARYTSSGSVNKQVNAGDSIRLIIPSAMGGFIRGKIKIRRT